MGLLGSLFSHHLVGLDIGISGIKAVELSGKKNPRLVAYNRVPSSVGCILSGGRDSAARGDCECVEETFRAKGFHH